MKQLSALLLVFFGFVCHAQIVNIPDANFKAMLLQASSSNCIASTEVPDYDPISYAIYINSCSSIDTNGDGEIQVTEAQAITWLNIQTAGITDVTGIEAFTNLYFLDCNGNQLTSLDLSGSPNLLKVLCYSNFLTSLNLSNLSNLSILLCHSNQLANINVSNSIHLRHFECSGNLLTNLDVSGLSELVTLNCDVNQLNNINITGCIGLQGLNCGYNQLTTLDVSMCENMAALYCNDNNLTSLFIKNGNAIWDTLLSGGSNGNQLLFNNNPNLEYICCDEEDLYMVQNKINLYGYTLCHVNTYCSFKPGGTYYTIVGASRFDGENNGCDASDYSYPNLKFVITNGSQTANLICDDTANYSVDVQAGTHTYTPVLENPDYFSVSPTTVTVDFPTQTSPFTQDFCVTAIGEHHDLEVTVIPLGVARPGFDATYKLIYKNKGNQLENPVLTYAFNDDVMDFLTASVVPSNQSSGLLSWNLTPLAPLQSGTIEVSFNLNSPTETPALNAGDVLNFVSAINGLNTDEMPNDNTFGFPQTVVNSLDPNDKTCLEGNAINPSLIGQYVHYMIRFENTGTYPAQNIVVKDIIDTTKFDSTTLQMVNSSHTCYTRINGNKVEFIFENINLPFDDATNDGYVVFKIKTKSNLTVGATISNSASIYFDYNFPIVTNTATSTFQLLNTSDFEFENEFVLYPIPTSNSLSVTSKNNLEITLVAIYNELGQLVQTETNPGLSFDVSGLKTGVYIVKVTSEKGTSFSQFIKN